MLAYLTNRGALAARVLAATYPVLAQLVGDESFASLARHFWRQAPPLRGDLKRWGAELADFLDASPLLADSVLDAASIALLTSADREQVTLTAEQRDAAACQKMPGGEQRSFAPSRRAYAGPEAALVPAAISRGCFHAHGPSAWLFSSSSSKARKNSQNHA